jgi:hypothetical protein
MQWLRQAGMVGDQGVPLFGVEDRTEPRLGPIEPTDRDDGNDARNGGG